MFKVTAPLRIDLAGGMTDLPVFSSDIGTAIINLAIDVYSDPEKTQIPAHLPTGTGLGGSSRLSVCLTTAKQKTTAIDRGQIACAAYNFEVNEMGIEGGFQDFISAAFGGLNYINFNTLDITNLTNNPYLGMKLDPELKNYLDGHMVILLLKTNQTSSALVAEDQIRRYKENPDQIRPILLAIKKCNQDMFKLLTSPGKLSEQLVSMGRIMNASTKLQKQLSPLVCRDILSDWQKRAEPFTYGIRTPGAGANSLFLLVKPDMLEPLLSEFSADDVDILFTSINKSGVKVN